MKNICIFGMGGVGGYYGGKMANAVDSTSNKDYKIYFIARGKHLEEIRKNGLVLKTGKNEVLTCRPKTAADNMRDFPSPDLCLVCVKEYDLTGALMELKKSVGKETVILPLLNGVDIYDRVKSAFPENAVLPACTYVGTHIEKPGTVSQSGPDGLILFGNDPHRDTDIEWIKKLFDLSGIHYEWKEEPQTGIWGKYLFIASFGMTTAASGLPIDGVLEDPFWKRKTEELIEEIHLLGLRKGVKFPENAKAAALAKGGTFPSGTKTSFQRDMEAGGKNELGLFGGTINRMGKELGIPTPAALEVYRILENKIRERTL